MKPRNFDMSSSGGGAALTVRVTPHAAHDELSEILPDGTLHIRLTAQGDAAVNQSLIQFLARRLEVKPAQIEIVAGQVGSDKLVAILNLDAKSVNRKLAGS